MFKLSTSQTCPLCPQVYSALHIFPGCQHTQIRNMITERHNLACRMIFKAISKTSSLGSCVISIDIGSNERMTIQNLQISETAESRIVPKWLFPPHFSEKDRYNSSRPDFVLFLCSVQLVLRSGVLSYSQWKSLTVLSTKVAPFP